MPVGRVLTLLPVFSLVEGLFGAFTISKNGPYIEASRWPDFHLAMLAAMREALVPSLLPSLRPRYIVVPQERVYLEHTLEGQQGHIRPDLLVARSSGTLANEAPGGSVALVPPVEITLPMPEEVTERCLTIRDRETRNVVTIVELLSPSNKRTGSDGRTQYLAKRDSVPVSRTNLVEIDLLRDGERLPAARPLPPTDYYVIVSRGRRRPSATAFPITLRQTLPSISIPLAHGEPDVNLDLQAAFTSAYDGGGYDFSLDYDAPVEPALSEADAAWAQDMLKSRE